MSQREELDGCQSCGKTIDEAVKMIKEALECYIENFIEYGDPIPEPDELKNYNGKIPYRTTPQKHYKIAKKSKSTGKSINKLIDEAVDNLLAS